MSGYCQRELVKIAFQMKEGVVPYQSDVPAELRPALAARYGNEFESLERNAITHFPAVDHRLTDDPKIGGQTSGVVQDAFGSWWNLTGNVFHMEKPALPEPDLSGFHLPDLKAYHRNYAHERIERQIRKGEGTFIALEHVFGLFERAWAIRGFENFLVDLCEEESFCEQLLEMIADWMILSVEEILRYPVDAIMFTDDYADNRGVMFGIERFRKFFLPHWRRIFDRVHKAGVYCVLHVCGNALPAVGDLVNAGLDCLESLQPECMDVYQLKNEYGRDLRLWGGVGIQKLLTFGTPEQVYNETQRLKERLGKGGGYVLAPTKPFNEAVPPENVMAYLRAAAFETGTSA